MKLKNGLEKMPRRKIPNSLRLRCSFLLCLVLCLGAFASPKTKAKDVVTPCQISVSPEAKEANFVALYSFDVEAGKPVNILRVKNDFLPDDDFVACISRWKLPSVRGKAQAEFSYKHAVGWTEITVSGKDFRKTLRPDGAQPESSKNSP